MSEKDLNKCGCGCGENKEGSCGDGCGCSDNHDHGHDHECGCGCGEHEHETFVVDLTDEEGNNISCEVVDAFEYNDQEYVLVQNPQDGSVYLFKSEGEEGELTIPEDAEFEAVTKYYEEELAK